MGIGIGIALTLIIALTGKREGERIIRRDEILASAG